MMAENEEDKDDFSEVLPMLAGAADNLHKKIRSLNEILTFKQTLGSAKGESSVSGVRADVKSSLSLEIKAADYRWGRSPRAVKIVEPEIAELSGS